jgi:hypothetical protein
LDSEWHNFFVPSYRHPGERRDPDPPEKGWISPGLDPGSAGITAYYQAISILLPQKQNCFKIMVSLHVMTC